ncbi:5-methylcytosine restriction system specificity protein McrC [Candidatus Lucifugimonas marina]|uniref:5-methylcytosine restriction system specificity protein McrC n=1 Tax=Candidatus Lucifugimonas marina TaxID=3038979 RepID=UPI00319DAAAB
MVGTIDIDGRHQLVIEPKTEPSDDWIAAVLDLMFDSSRIEISAERTAGERVSPPKLLDALAGIYSARLSQALRRDGPLVLLERRRKVLGTLRGRLNVTQWIKGVATTPHLFPVEVDLLETDNDFSQAMAAAAVLLAGETSSPLVRSRLMQIRNALRPGAADTAIYPPGVLNRHLPTQWNAYEPAWSVAKSVLKRVDLLGSAGTHRGVEVAIEPWPLLEELLRRCLVAAASMAQKQGRNLNALEKKHHPILLPSDPKWKKRNVEPDGLLAESGKVIASFEAKYSASFVSGAGPPREHVFQALATAAAVGAEVSVLVYPEAFDPVRWSVIGFNGKPHSMVAVGLGMFSYRKRSGELSRAKVLIDAIS